MRRKDGSKIMFELIFEILYRATLFLALIYSVDLAVDGKLDIPHFEVSVDWNKAWKRIKKFLRR